jgi:hypothetical protein
MDKLKHIRELLQKFYDGESNRQEELELEAFFRKAEALPEEFITDREFFASIDSLHQPVDVPENLRGKIIDRLAAEEGHESRRRRISIYSLSGLAAGMLIIFSVYLGLMRGSQSQDINQFAIKDPELAYEEAKKALVYISDKWNSGTAELTSLKQVNKGFETVSTMQKLSSGSRELNLLGNLQKAEALKL